MSKQEQSRGWIGFDLDKTISMYDSYNGDPYYIGPPILSMIERIRAYLEDGYEVRILTARVSNTGGYNRIEDIEKMRKAVEDWTEEHVGVRLRVTNEKDYHMVLFYDDRAISVIPNTGICIVPTGV